MTTINTKLTQDAFDALSPIEQLWEEVEDNSWMLTDIGAAARKLNWMEVPYDENKHITHDPDFQYTNPENNYWMRNGTFALLILAAEGEL